MIKLKQIFYTAPNRYIPTEEVKQILKDLRRNKTTLAL